MLNWRVILAYTIFVGATLLTVISYRGIPLSMGPLLDATGYIYVTMFGATIFHEKMTKRRLIALGLILCGICVYSLGL
jgi:multidrug transporter EmrE-like cation transporter